MDAIVSGQSCIPPLPCNLEHTVPLEGVSFKEPEYGFDFGLGQLSQESSREEMGSSLLRDKTVYKVRIRALEPDYLHLNPGSRVYAQGLWAS